MISKKWMVACIVFLGLLLSRVLLTSDEDARAEDFPSGTVSDGGRGEFEGSPPDMFAGPEEGDNAPKFRLKTLEGETVELGEVVGKKPVVLEFGSYTCPVFRKKHPGMETLYEKYGDEAVFLTVYIIEAHPKGDPSPYSGREWVTPENQRSGILYRQPVTEEQRKKLAEQARTDLGIQTPILIDDLNNSTWKAYGAAPNAAYLIGTDGRIKLRQGWFKSRELEKALARELA